MPEWRFSGTRIWIPSLRRCPRKICANRLIAVERAKLERPTTLAGELRGVQTAEEIAVIERNLNEVLLKTPPQPEYDLLRYVITHSPKPLRPMARAFSFSCLVGKAHHVESFAEMGIVAA